MRLKGGKVFIDLSDKLDVPATSLTDEQVKAILKKGLIAKVNEMPYPIVHDVIFDKLLYNNDEPVGYRSIFMNINDTEFAIDFNVKDKTIEFYQL